MFKIVCEDTSRYLPGEGLQAKYLTHYVYDTSKEDRHPLTGQPKPYLCFSGTLEECREYVRRNTKG